MDDTQRYVTIGLVVFIVTLLARELYTISWRPPEIAGSYERRLPGEFLQDKSKQYLVERVDRGEFRMTPPAPEKPALIRFVGSKHAKVYVDGLCQGMLRLRRIAQCDVLDLGGGVVLTRETCKA